MQVAHHPMSRNAAKGGAQAVRYPAIPAEGSW